MVKPLDRASPLPLWAQLLVQLRSRLAEGDFEEGFPTDAALMEEYGVSRQTVREAIRHLVSEGLVERQRGRGSRVRKPEFEQPMGSLYSLFRLIEGQGVRQTSVLRALEERVDPVIALQLGLDRRAKLVYVERQRLAGGAPLALDRAWLPADMARALLEADFEHTAFYDELVRRCGFAPEGGRERVQPTVPLSEEAALLGLGEGEPAFWIERITWAKGRRVEVRHTIVRGDRYGLVSEWPAPGERAGVSGPPVLRLMPLAVVGGTGDPWH